MNTPQSRNKLSRETWQNIQSRFELGTSNAKQLSMEHGINSSTLHRRKKRYGWKEFGERADEAAEQARRELTATLSADYKAKAKIANERHAQFYAGIQTIGAQYLKTLSANINEADPKKRKHIGREVYALAAMTSALKTAIDGERTVLKIDSLDLHSRQDGFDRLCDILGQRQRAYIAETHEQATDSPAEGITTH
jgi:hypothetical protein